MSQLTLMANLPNDASNPSSVTVWSVYKPGSRITSCEASCGTKHKCRMSAADLFASTRFQPSLTAAEVHFVLRRQSV
ncbi:hypothetical protein NP493_49g04014 [Ridgeia piscesae]|uniref:Uncharacterized protein n=1 Tax=Ridgeia piscesae TaxID=27915 RepID=A0AAD9PBF5_RIDPI|nr:hypothetical protein NP493_49g04014 [Ridgeia piscesae]